MKTKISILVFSIWGCSFQNLFASDSIPAGNVSGHWLQTNSPYKIYGNITVPQDSLLQIDPGVVVEFQGHYQLLQKGRVLAIGTALNKITFTALSDWWGIRFDGIQSFQDSSLFIYCMIEKGKANGTGNYANGGAFFISNFSKIRIANSIIKNNYSYINGGAFYCDHSSPLIIGNTISNNNANSYYGGGIYCNYSSPSIINNIISYNVGSICCQSSSPSIIGNTISYTTTNSAIFCQDSSPLIFNNIISYNPMGIYIDNSSPSVIGNVITNNTADYGAGIRCRFSSSPNIFNNTISNNTANIYGGGLYTDHSSSPIVKNNIIWGNTAASGGNQLALDQTSFPTFYNCDVQGGAANFYYYDAPNTFGGSYVDNIDADPLFIDDATGNYSLQSTSPCINAGTIDTTGLSLLPTDLASSARICDNRVDIGAYENCITGIQLMSFNKNDVTIYPNPTKDRITFEISENDLPKNVKLMITNVLGENVKQVFVNSSKTTIQLDELTSGIYFYQLESEKEVIKMGKIILE